MGCNNSSLFSCDSSEEEDFRDECLFWIDDDSSGILDIDPYTWRNAQKVEEIITKTIEKDKIEWFKKVQIELNGELIEVEYKIDTSDLLSFNDAIKKANDNWSRLVNEEEFQAIYNSIWYKEFIKEFPWIMYSDEANTIWSFGKMAYFWINSYGLGLSIKVKIFSNEDSEIYTSEIWKQYGACCIFIKK